MSAIDDEWLKYLQFENASAYDRRMNNTEDNDDDDNDVFVPTAAATTTADLSVMGSAPTASPLYISTKSNISFLNQNIDIYDIFWKLPRLSFHEHKDGIVKLQLRIKFQSNEEKIAITERLQTIECSESVVIKSNQLQHKTQQSKPKQRPKRYTNKPQLPPADPDGGASAAEPESEKPKIIPYYEVNKISIGLSNKDLMKVKNKGGSSGGNDAKNKSKNGKKKKQTCAFYNCIVIIYRMFIDQLGEFKEFHIKLFNTGKITIPGVVDDSIHLQLLDRVLSILQPLCITETPLQYVVDSGKIVLINSNFNCGFYINRDVMANVLKNKYGLVNTIFEVSSYPGVQSKVPIHADGSILPTATATVIPDATAASDAVEPQKCSMPCKDKKKRKKTMKNKSDENSVSCSVFRTGSVLISGKYSADIIYKVYDYIRNILQTEYAVIKQLHNEDIVIKKKSKPRKRIIDIFITAEQLVPPSQPLF